MSKKKMIYEPPLARDLSCIYANGGLFTENIEGGASPTGICLNGTAVTGSTCTVGTRVEPTGTCAPTGYDVAGNYCSGGSGGSSGCISGTYAST